MAGLTGRVGEVATVPPPYGTAPALQCPNTGHPTAQKRANRQVRSRIRRTLQLEEAPRVTVIVEQDRVIGSGR